MARLIPRYDTTSPLSPNAYGGEAGHEYRQLDRAYARALRLLRRQARRGDARSALAEIRVQQEAMDAGLTPGGIRSRETFDTERRAFTEGRARDSALMAKIRAFQDREIDRELGGPENETSYDPDYRSRRTDRWQTPTGDEPMDEEEEDEETYGYTSPDRGGRLLSRVDRVATERRRTVNPAATPGAGRGEPIFDRNRIYGRRAYV